MTANGRRAGREHELPAVGVDVGRQQRNVVGGARGFDDRHQFVELDRRVGRSVFGEARVEPVEVHERNGHDAMLGSAAARNDVFIHGSRDHGAQVDVVRVVGA